MKVPDASLETLAAETSEGVMRASCEAGVLREILRSRFPEMSEEQVEEAIKARVVRDECNSDN